MKNNLLLFFLLIFLCHSSVAQKEESKKEPADTSSVKRKAGRAALYSAIIPGLGQAYNKKYWKIPIIYAGGIALVLGIQFNDHYYHVFQTAYKYRVDGDSTTVDDYVNIYPDPNSLLIRRDYYRRSRDLLYIIAGIVYVANIIDAYVDAQLSNFDVSDNLSLRAQPILDFTRNYEPVAGLKVSFNLH
jgi:hypothetical protein